MKRNPRCSHGPLAVAGALSTGAVALLTARDACALPTPDVIFSVGQLAPVLASAVAGTCALGVAAFVRFVDRRKDPKRFLVRCVFALTAISMIASIAFAFSWSARREDRSARDLAAYFRCDLASHEAQHRGQVLYDELEKNGRRVDLREIDARLGSDPSYDPVLLTVSSDLIYDAGFLVVGPDTHRRRFRLVHQGELRAALEAIPEARRKDTEVVVDVYQRMFFGQHSDADVRDYLAMFPRLRFLRSYVDRDAYTYVEDGGTIRKATHTPLATRGWPVRNERYYFEEPKVEFHDMKRLVPAGQLAAYVSDPRVWFIAPYDSGQRSRYVHLEYLSAYLRARLPPGDRDVMESETSADDARILADFERDKVLLFDQDSPSYSADVARILDRIRGQPFVIVGVTKYDWIHVGLNLAYLAHLDARAHGVASGYLGGSLQASEYAAAQAIAARPSLASHALERGRGLLASALADLKSHLGGSVGWALVVLALVVRLAVAPLPAIAARSLRRRRELEAMADDDARSGRPPYYLECRSFVAKHLGIARGWEVVSSIAGAVLVLPTYSLLVYPHGPLQGERFLWIADLAAPSAAVNVAVAACVACRLWQARRGAPGGTRPWHAVVALASLAISFAAMQRVLPAGVALAAVVALVVAAVVDALVAWRMRPARALLGLAVRPAPRPSDGRFVIPLAEVAPGEAGNKASRLAELARAGSSLFEVPTGCVLRVDAGPFASDRTGARAALEDTVSRLPGAAAGCTELFAVRSCAVDEDGGSSSQAGKYLSVLDVEPAGIAEAVRRVRASFGCDAGEVPAGAAVIVQRMVRADYSGVLFTSSPERRGVAHIEFGVGLADALVSGESRPTAVRVSRFSGAIVSGAVPDRTIRAMLERVFVAGMAIERAAGAPQDVEWAYCVREHKLFVVQARAVTAFVEPAVVEREQARAILGAYESGVRERHAAAWSLSASAEVVDEACPFTLSLLEEIYRPSSSYDAALALSGLRRRAPDERSIAIFGHLYQGPVARRSPLALVLDALAQRRARRALVRSWRATFESRSRHLDRLRDGLQRALIPRGAGAEQLVSAILARVDELVREVYPLVFASSLAAQLTMTSHSRGAAIATLNSEYVADLARLAADGDVRRFLRRWAHRSVSDYDLRTPSFGEDREQCIRHARGFLDLRASSDPGAVSPDDDDPHAAFVRQRELAKDLSIAFLRTGIRPLLLALAERLALACPDDVFFFTLADLRGLLAGPGAQERARTLARTRRADHEVLAARRLPDTLSVAALERLEEPGTAEQGAPANAADASRGRMLSVETAFEGPIVRVDGATRPTDLPARAVLLTRTLRPDLVPLFRRALGVVTEKGGYLSHAAIVARELGTPVLLLENAGAMLADGDVVHVTDTGRLEVEKRPSPPLRKAS